MVVVNLDAEATGSYGVATVPEARGLGLARILTLQALHAARDAGSTLGVLHSAPMAISSHQKLGFRAVAPFAQRERLDVAHVGGRQPDVAASDLRCGHPGSRLASG